MVSKNIRRFILLCLAVWMSLGFYIFPGIKGWRLDTSTTAGKKVFISLTPSGRSITNDLPASDTLAASGATLTDTQILASVIADYNAITDSNLNLVTSADSDFASYKTEHQITISEGSAAGASSGEANLTFKSSYITDCVISITPTAYSSAKNLVHLLSHEIGHCIGLQHAQESVYSVMSYFYNEDDAYRLAIDDKMGIINLYGKNASNSDEKATFGFACATQ